MPTHNKEEGNNASNASNAVPYSHTRAYIIIRSLRGDKEAGPKTCTYMLYIKENN